jgi:hypothetical protein
MYGGGECVFLVKGVFLCVGVVLVCSLLWEFSLVLEKAGIIWVSNVGESDFFC